MGYRVSADFHQVAIAEAAELISSDDALETYFAHVPMHTHVFPQLIEYGITGGLVQRSQLRVQGAAQSLRRGLDAIQRPVEDRISNRKHKPAVQGLCPRGDPVQPVPPELAAECSAYHKDGRRNSESSEQRLGAMQDLGVAVIESYGHGSLRELSRCQKLGQLLHGKRVS